MVGVHHLSPELLADIQHLVDEFSPPSSDALPSPAGGALSAGPESAAADSGPTPHFFGPCHGTVTDWPHRGAM